ncbi:MAG: lysophospholipid acyltransferase family protein [Fibrobacteres bacterium]|nr:lysophospholipid acyltransferase family protein [Fibrobacterota bacterium]
MNAWWIPPAVAMFEAVFRPAMSMCLQVRLRADSGIDPTGAVVFVSNHHSWWDGFLVRELHRKLMPSSPLWSVMLERELAPRGWLRRLGCLGVSPGEGSSVRRLLRDLSEISHRPKPWAVSYFPQGCIRPAGTRPLGFRSGLERMLPAMGDVQVVPVALRIEPLNTRRPHAFIWAGAPLERKKSGGTWALRELETALESHLDALDKELVELAEHASLRWPGEIRS